MSEPGWYHAQGDPPDTVRYWDGVTWQGEPTSASGSNDVIYYAAAPDTQIDLGDIATRTTLAEQATESTDTSYAVSPYSVSKASVNVKRKRRFPEGLKNLTILVGILKAIPLLLIAGSLITQLAATTFDVRPFTKYHVPEVDLTSGKNAVVAIFGGILLIGTIMIISQIRAAINDQAGSLFAVSLLMTCFDIVSSSSQWLSVFDGGAPTTALFATVATGLQACVTVWAGFLANRQ